MKLRKILLTILCLTMTFSAVGCGSNAIEWGGSDARDKRLNGSSSTADSEQTGSPSTADNEQTGSSPTTYKGSEYCEEIPSGYYNLIDNAPIISHTDFADTLAEVYDGIKDDYSINALDVLYDIVRKKYDEPIAYSTGMFSTRGAIYSTVFGNICVVITSTTDYDGGDLEYAIVNYDYSSISGPSGNADDLAGYSESKSYATVDSSSMEKMYGKNMISSDDLNKDYSGLTYSQIADELGSAGLLSLCEVCGKGYDNRLVATWYCPEEDSILVTVVEYDLEKKDSHADFTQVTDLGQDITFYEKTSVYTEKREEFNSAYYAKKAQMFIK